MSRLNSLCRPSALLLMVLLVPPAWGASLPEVVELVLRRHPDIQSSQALLRAAEERVGQARSPYLPSLGLDSVSIDSSDRQTGQPIERTTRRSDLVLRWNLFRGLADFRSAKEQDYRREAAEASLAETHERVALQVVEVYLELLRLRGLVELGEAHGSELRRLEDTVGKRAESGRTSAVDISRTRLGVIQNQADLGRLRGQLQAMEQRYRLITGMPPGPLVEPQLDESALTQPIDDLMARVIEGNHGVRALASGATASAEAVGVARGRLFPSLDLELRKRLQTKIDPVPLIDTDNSRQVQITYQVPLGGETFSRVREAVERKTAAEAQMDSELLRVRADLASYWAEWQEARAIAPRLSEREDASRRVVLGSDLQFDAGRRAVDDLVTSRSEYFRARGDVIANAIEQTALTARVLSLLGTLRPKLREATAAPVVAAPSSLPPPLPPAVEAPAAAEEAPQAVEDAALRRRIQEWTAAWSRKDFAAYRAFYGPDFIPGVGVSIADWEKSRQQRLAKPASISVACVDIEVRLSSDDQAITECNQSYRSPGYQDDVRKSLTWKRTNGNWFLAREVVLD